MNDPFVQHAEPEEEDLWLISYADLLTLLIAFFAMMLTAATSQTSSMSSLQADLDALVTDEALQGARVVQDGRGVGIVLGEALLFDVGSDALRPEARGWLERVAERLAAVDGHRVIVEGHTDDLPIRTGRHASNWELSSARALTVVHALEAAGLPRERISAQSFADTQPALTHGEGTLEQRRAANRRVVIRVE